MSKAQIQFWSFGIGDDMRPGIVFQDKVVTANVNQFWKRFIFFKTFTFAPLVAPT